MSDCRHGITACPHCRVEHEADERDLAGALALLRRLEWSLPGEKCPVCGGEKRFGHLGPDYASPYRRCALADVLSHPALGQGEPSAAQAGMEPVSESVRATPASPPRCATCAVNPSLCSAHPLNPAPAVQGPTTFRTGDVVTGEVSSAVPDKPVCGRCGGEGKDIMCSEGHRGGRGYASNPMICRGDGGTLSKEDCPDCRGTGRNPGTGDAG